MPSGLQCDMITNATAKFPHPELPCSCHLVGKLLLDGTTFAPLIPVAIVACLL
jgi:hypothetical protein